MKQQPKVKVVTATEAKNRFGELIKGAYLRAEHLIVKRDGIPVVAIVPMDVYARLVNSADLSAELSQEVLTSSTELQARAQLESLLARVHAKVPTVKEDEAEQDIAAAVQAVRKHA